MMERSAIEILKGDLEDNFKKKFAKAVVENNLHITVEKLSNVFQVSEEAVRRRIEELLLRV